MREMRQGSGVVGGGASALVDIQPDEPELLTLTVASPAVAAQSREDVAPPSPVRRALDEEGLWERWHLIAAAVLSWLCLGLALLVEHLTVAPPWAPTALFVLSYVAGGTFATQKALSDLVLERKVGVDLLMITAAVGAALIGYWEEGAILLGLFSTSNALEHHALGRTQRAVRALMELSPEVATVLRNGEERLVPVEELRLGDTVLVRPGERVAVDGCVLTGETAIDQSAITGESIPVSKAVGDRCFAGTINGYGAIRVRVDRLHRRARWRRSSSSWSRPRRRRARRSASPIASRAGTP